MAEELDIDAAIDGARAALAASGEVLRGYFRGTMSSEMKPDATIVTEADAAAERALRFVLTQRFPGHRVTGEELPPEGAASRYEWVLDPIDGTIAFACGKAQFSTLVALLEDGAPVLGVIDQPVAGERWVGARGRPTTFNGNPCRTSGVTELAQARLGTTDPALFTAEECVVFERLRAGARVTSLGGDGYAYGLLASGHLDLIFETGLKRHDVAALVPVLLGAGAAVTDRTGAAYAGRSIGAGAFSLIAAASDDLLNVAVSG